MSEIKVKNPVGEALEEIYRWFDLLNAEYWDNKLPTPVITIQKTRKGNLGHCTVDKVWRPYDMPESDETNDECCYEVNFAAQALDREAVDLVSTLEHECVHLYNLVAGIKDCSGKIHNKKFKACAEEHGLICEKDKSVGWGYTRPTNKLKEFIENTIKPDMEKISYYRIIPIKPTQEKEKKTCKWVCTNCGQKFTAKKDANVICGVCNQPFEAEEE